MAEMRDLQGVFGGEVSKWRGSWQSNLCKCQAEVHRPLLPSMIGRQMTPVTLSQLAFLCSIFPENHPTRSARQSVSYDD